MNGRANRPVISIGNLALGGRGKTPLAALVARLLIDAGERPAILSRGYRRRRPAEGVVVVSDGKDVLADLDRSGDEPLLLARTVPGAAVLVCDVRALAAAVAESTLGTTVHILDDGFQHQSLRRDIDIVVITPDDLDGRRVPFGRLRSRVKSLVDAHAVIVDGHASEHVLAKIERAISTRTRVFSMARALGQPELLEPERTWPPGRWPVVALCAIARPEGFRDSLRDAGWHVARTISMRDHHAYTRRDLDKVTAAVREHGAEMVLTTAKDAVRLLPLRPLPVPIAAVPLEVTVGPANEFSAWLLTQLRGLA